LFAASAGAFSDPPEVGKPAPAFTLMSHEGKKVNLKDYQGKWVVLYFYPKDFTSGCTVEARNFQRDIAKYEKANAVILGVSVDDVNSHKSFCEKEGLNFKLLADTEASTSEAYASVMEYNGKKLSARNTFVIDPNGNVAKVFMKVKPMEHSDEVLAALAELQKK
jgi:peroxiredoxin Q/BCP